MLEFCVRLAQAETDISPRQQGDIVAVKLAGSPWGTKEYQEYLIIQDEDPEIEAQLIAMRDAGDTTPAISYPYAEFVPADLPNRPPIMTRASSARVDVATLSLTQPDLLDPTVSKAITTVDPERWSDYVPPVDPGETMPGLTAKPQSNIIVRFVRSVLGFFGL